MNTTEILERLYDVRSKPPRRWPSIGALRERYLDWVRRHNWSLAFVALGMGLWCLTHIYYYNNLVSLEFDVLAAGAQIEASQQKRSHIQRNVVGLLRFYEGYERGLTMDVTEMRTRAENAEAAPTAPSAPSDTDTFGSLIGRLNAVAEAYPGLRLADVVQRFLQAIVEIEAEIAIRIAEYNTAVNVYTTVMRQFPGIFFAASLGFEEVPFWETPVPEDLPYRALDL